MTSPSPKRGICNPYWKLQYKISGKRVLIKEYVWRACRNSATLFWMVPYMVYPTPYGLPFLEIRGLQFTIIIISYPILFQEQVKLQTSNLAGTFTGPIWINFGEKGAWAYPGTAQFFGVPLLSQERVKLRTSNLVGTFIGSIGTKAHEKCWE